MFRDCYSHLWPHGKHLQADKPLPTDPPPAPLREVADALRSVAKHARAGMRGLSEFHRAQFLVSDLTGQLLENKSAPGRSDGLAIVRSITPALDRCAAGQPAPGDAELLDHAANLICAEPAPNTTPPTVGQTKPKRAMAAKKGVNWSRVAAMAFARECGIPEAASEQKSRVREPSAKTKKNSEL